MRRAVYAILSLLLLAPLPAFAQAGYVGILVKPVTTCNIQTYTSGVNNYATMDLAGNLCVNVAVGGSGGSSNVNLTGINGTAPSASNPLPVAGNSWVSVPTDQPGVTTASAVGINAPATSTFCTVTPSVAGVNRRSDSTNPTTGTGGGVPVGLGQTDYIYGATLLGTTKYINQSAANGALIYIACFKPG